jgi:hypothetical protein
MTEPTELQRVPGPAWLAPGKRTDSVEITRTPAAWGLAYFEQSLADRLAQRACAWMLDDLRRRFPLLDIQPGDGGGSFAGVDLHPEVLKLLTALEKRAICAAFTEAWLDHAPGTEEWSDDARFSSLLPLAATAPGSDEPARP